MNSFNKPFCVVFTGLTCLHLAAMGGYINIMQLLLNGRANVNATEGKSGRTVLHFAADWGNTAMVKFLLSQRSIDPNVRTYAGLSPMLLAVGRRNSEVVSELLNSGALYETYSISDDSDEDVCDDRSVSFIFAVILFRINSAISGSALGMHF